MDPLHPTLREQAVDAQKHDQHIGRAVTHAIEARRISDTIHS
jgi:hypothetical protein